MNCNSINETAKNKYRIIKFQRNTQKKLCDNLEFSKNDLVMKIRMRKNAVYPPGNGG